MNKKNYSLFCLTVFVLFAFNFSVFGEVQKINKVTDILSQWSPENHVYVKGSIGFGKSELEGIEKWVEKTYPNWFIVFADDSSNEAFNVPGENYTQRGFIAAEYCLGIGLMNKAEFQKLVDKETKTPNGCTFFLSFDNWDYRCGPSQFHKKYGIDEKRFDSDFGGILNKWLGDGGMRLNAAITEMIEAVESRVQLNISEQKIARETALANAKSSIVNAQQRLESLKENYGSFISEYPKLTGSLVQINFPELSGKINNAQRFLDAGNINDSAQESESVVNLCNSYLESWNLYPSAGDKIKDLAKSHDSLSKDEYAYCATDLLKRFKDSIDSARVSWENGDLKYSSFISDSSASLSKIKSKISSERTKVAVFRAAKRIGLWGLGLLLLAVAIFTNRLRRPAKKEAEMYFSAWKKALGEKIMALMNLHTSCSSILVRDSKSSFSFEGETLDVANRLSDNLGHLFIMHACAQQIYNDSLELIKPRNLFIRFFNLFSSRNYNAAIKRLNQMVEFSKDSNISFIISGVKKKPEEVLFAPLEHFQPFKIAFAELIKRFNERAEQSIKDLNQLESAQSDSLSFAEKSKTGINEIRGLFTELDNLSTNEGLEVPSAINNLIPVFTKKLGLAEECLRSNPIRSLSISLVLSEEINIVKKIAEELICVIEENKPAILAKSASLKDKGISLAWAMEGLADIFVKSDKYFNYLAINDSLDFERGFSVHTLCAELMVRVETAEEFMIKLETSLLPEIQKCSDRVNEVRTKIIPNLATPQYVLAEEDFNPDDLIKKANEFVATVRTSISMGNIDQASNIIQSVNDLINNAKNIVNETENKFVEFNSFKVKISEKCVSLAASIVEAGNVLAALSSNYSPEALLLGEGDKMHPRANDTVFDNAEEIHTAIANRAVFLQTAEQLYSSGKILEAYDHLEKADGVNEFIEYRLQEIVEKKQKIDETVKSVLSLLNSNTTKFAELEVSCNNDKTTSATILLYQSAKNVFDSHVDEIKSVRKTNPFAIKTKLEQLEKEADLIKSQVQKDFAEYDEVKSSIGRAEDLIIRCKIEYGKTQSDDIPDSQVIVNSSHAIDLLESGLAKVKNQFAASEKHSNWYSLDDFADGIYSDAQKILAELKSEIVAGEAVQTALNSARRIVKEAQNWNRIEGVAIDENFGSHSLNLGTESLLMGNYEKALHYATCAAKEATNALDRANTKVKNIRREREIELERQAAEKKRIEKARTSYRSSSSSHRSGTGMGGGHISRSSTGMGGGRIRH